jgi:nitrous oxidase accessory protein NosD
MPKIADRNSVDVINTRIHNNYFGIYTFNTFSVHILDSEIYDNIEYGLDFHDYSENYLISGNEIYRNGNHGLIFSKFCQENRIVNNVIRDNNTTVFVKGEDRDYGTHGIMLHHFSTDNLIENNTLINNYYWHIPR